MKLYFFHIFFPQTSAQISKLIKNLIIFTKVVGKLEFDAKAAGRTEAKQHMTPKLPTHSLTKSIRHQKPQTHRSQAAYDTKATDS